MHETTELCLNLPAQAPAVACCLLHVWTHCFAGWDASLRAAACQREWAGPGHVEGDVS